MRDATGDLDLRGQVRLLAPVRLQQHAVDLLQVDDCDAVADSLEPELHRNSVCNAWAWCLTDSSGKSWIRWARAHWRWCEGIRDSERIRSCGRSYQVGAMRIASDETSIVGTWSMLGGKVEADETCLRIERLVHQHLREIGRDASGWEVLYVDPTDGRFWELTYPQGEMQGGAHRRSWCLALRRRTRNMRLRFQDGPAKPPPCCGVLRYALSAQEPLRGYD